MLLKSRQFDLCGICDVVDVSFNYRAVVRKSHFVSRRLRGKWRTSWRSKRVGWRISVPPPKKLFTGVLLLRRPLICCVVVILPTTDSATPFPYSRAGMRIIQGITIACYVRVPVSIFFSLPRILQRQAS